jgi:hypothetical protein
MTFPAGTQADGQYESWKANWQPPKQKPRALPGFVILEFSPFGTPGVIIRPEQASNNAFVVSDGYEGRHHREGFLTTGMEVAYTGTGGDNFTWEERTFCRVKKEDVELYFPKEQAA